MYRLILILGILLFSICGQAQDEYAANSSDVDKITYAQYLNKSWNELIKTGNAALESHLDFFYLRFRLGVAYYEQKQFRLAERHFIKAYEFNCTDTLILEYLYFSHLYSGHYEQAQKLVARFDSSMKSKTGTSSKNHLLYAFIDIGTKISSAPRLFDNGTFLEVGLGHKLTNHLSINHMYTTYGQRSYFGAISQNQYFISASIPIARTWNISPAFHYVNYRIDTSRMQQIPQELKFNSKMEGIIGSFLLKKYFAHLEIAPGYAFSTLNNNIQHQVTLGIFTYPFANQSVMIGINGYLQHRNEVLNRSYGFRFYTHFTPYWKLKLSVNYYHGTMSNFNEENGALVNNSLYSTQNQFNFLIDWNVTLRFTIFGLYQYENKVFSSNEFNYNTLLFGLKYKF